MSDIALINFKENISGSDPDKEMPGLDIHVAPTENGGFEQDPEKSSRHHEQKDSVSGDKTSGIGTRSLTSEDACSDFGLHQAAREGAVEVLKASLQKVIDDGQDILRVIDYKDREGLAPLHHAAKCNRKEALLLLVDNGAYLDSRGEDENTPLHLAAKYNSVAAAKILVERGALVNLPNMYGTTALHFACRRGNTEIGRLLVNQAGIDINAPDHSQATPLHQAAISGDREIAEELLKRGADISLLDVEMETALHFAAEEGSFEVIDVILQSILDEIDGPQPSLDKAAYVDLKSSQHDTALHLACTSGCNQSVQMLIKHGANVHVLADGKVSPLHFAAANGNIEVADTLLHHRARINARDADQITPLHRAAFFGRVDMIMFLLEKGASINCKDVDNYTPLLTSSWKGQTDAVKVLIDKGAKIQALDTSLKTCLHLAVEHDNLATFKMLLDNGASGLVNSTDKNYMTPMHCAAREGNIEALEILLEHGAKADIGDNSEKTPLHLAAMEGKPKCVRLLCKSSPFVKNSTDENGRMPLHLAATHGNLASVRILVDMGAEIDARDDTAWTPLDYTAKNGFFKSMKILLENDAAVDARDKNNNTPLHWAAANGHVVCVSMLLDYGADIALKNIEGKNCLDFAVENFHQETCMGLVTHSRWREVMDNVGSDGTNPMRKLIRAAPSVAEEVLNRCITKSKQTVDHIDYSITYDFRYIDRDPESDIHDDHGFEAVTMAKYNRESLLSHFVTKKLMGYKWARLGRVMYYTTLAVYLLFVACVTSVVVVERERDRNIQLDKLFNDPKVADKHKKSNVLTSSLAFTTIIPALTVTICGFNILKEILQMVIQKRRYFLKMNNYLEWTLYSSTMVFMLDFLIAKDAITFTQKWNAGAISVFLTWVNLLLFLTRFPYFGVYVEMFVEVFGTVLRVLIVFGVFIIAFSLSFYSLLRELPTFRTVERSLMKVAVMSIGELEYDNALTDSVGTKDAITGLPKVPMEGVTYVLYSIFLLLMPIITMNLLVGLAVGDIEAVRKTAYTRILKKQVDILWDMERNYPTFLRKWAHTKQLIVYPNQESTFDRIRRYLGYDDDYSYWKENQAEQMGIEEVLSNKLTETQNDIEKQKKRLKSLKNLIHRQGQLLRQIASKLEVSDSDSEGE